ncbi:MAG: hypothetical protein ACI8RD_003758 [Bacillariaceae sp.]|jgi:hypothetical protein
MRENHFYFVAVDIRTDSNADTSGFVREANAYGMVVGVIQNSKWIHHGSWFNLELDVGCWMQFMNYEIKKFKCMYGVYVISDLQKVHDWDTHHLFSIIFIYNHHSSPSSYFLFNIFNLEIMLIINKLTCCTIC